MTARKAALVRLADRIAEDVIELRRHDAEASRIVLAQVSELLEQEEARRSWGDHRPDPVLEFLESTPGARLQ